MGFELALVGGKFAAGARHHFSIWRLLCAGLIEIMVPIFISLLVSTSHHQASTLKRASSSEGSDSKTVVGHAFFLMARDGVEC